MVNSSVAPSPPVSWLFRASALLWAMWGAVHILAGVMTVRFATSGRTAEGFHGIAAAVPLETLQLDYPGAVSAILGQHGHNLAWFGVVTLAAAPFIWRRSAPAVFLAMLVGGLADLGYFVFIDLGDFAMPPGPQMTWICAAAIVTSGVGVFMERRRIAA